MKNTRHLYLGPFTLMLITILILNPTEAASASPEPTSPDSAPSYFVDGNGTIFQIQSSRYLNVTLTSNVYIHAHLESIPRIVSYSIEKLDESSTASITLSGFPPDTAYYKYQDGNLTERFTTDSVGYHSYLQDITNPHCILIVENASTITIQSDGNVYPSTAPIQRVGNVYTFKANITDNIVIQRDNIVLDGNGYTLQRQESGSWDGISLYNRQYVTIRNIRVKKFSYGVRLFNSRFNNISGNIIQDTYNDVYLDQSSNNTISQNAIVSGQYDPSIWLTSSSNNTISRNTIENGSGMGVFSSSSYNTITGNSIKNGYNCLQLDSSSYNTVSGNNFELSSKYATGIYLRGGVGSNYNLISGNTITTASSAYHYSAGIRVDQSWYNTIRRNTVKCFGRGISFSLASYFNEVYQNNFIDNAVQAEVVGAVYCQYFNKAKPVGGNYWSNWISPDNNHDGFVDSRYSFPGGWDDLPWTEQDGWVFDFSISATPESRTVAKGQSATYDVALTRIKGISQQVSLSLSGLPEGTTASFTPQQGNPTFSSSLLVTTSPSTPLGTHVLTITGTSVDVVHSTTVRLIVAPTITFQATGAAVPVTVSYTYDSTSGSITIQAEETKSIMVPYGSTVTFSYESTVSGGNGIQYVLESTDPESPLNNIADDITITGKYKTQYKITVTSAHDNPTGSDWVDQGGSFTASVTSPTEVVADDHQWVCTGFSLDGGAYQEGMIYTFTNVQAAHSIDFAWREQFWIQVNSAHDTPTAPQWVDQGGSLTVGVSSPADDNGMGTRYRCTGYTLDDNPPVTDGRKSYEFVDVQSAHIITFNWIAQYRLIVASDHDSPDPTVGEHWYDKDTPISASVTSPADESDGTRFRCTGWTGTGSVPASGTEKAVSFNINSPSTLTWNWITQYYLTVKTNPLGIDSPTGEGWYDEGKTAHVSTARYVDIVEGSSRYRFDSWTGASGTYADATVVMDAAKTATANYIVQHHLTVKTAPLGITTISGEDWYDENTIVELTAPTPVSVSEGVQHRFDYWDVDDSSQGLEVNPITVTMGAARVATAHYAKQYKITFDQSGVGSDLTSTVVTIDTIEYGVSSLPKYFWWDEGSTHDFTSASPLNVNGKRYIWTSTSGLSDLQSGSLTVTTSGSITGTYKTQYLLTVLTDPSGLTPVPIVQPTSPDGFYDAGTPVDLYAQAVNGYTFWYWSDPGSGTKNYQSSVDHITITMNAAHTAMAYYVPFTMNGHFTDSDFNPITSFDVVFTPSSGTTTVKLTATNPGTYYYTLQFKNNGPTVNTFTIEVTIPPEFVLKGAQPVQINFVPVIYTFAGGVLTVPISSVGTGQTFTMRVHLDYGLKGQAGFLANSATSYYKVYSFLTTANSVVARTPTLVATGKKVTAIGGFVTDINGVPKNGLKVTVTDPRGQTTELATGVMGDGFYFLTVPAGGPYTVKVFNSAGVQVGIKTNINVADSAFVEVDFNTLSPADPAIQGFITDNNGNPVGGVAVQLLDQRGKVIATTMTNAGGYYVFRFSAPGKYTVRIVVPTGYSCTTSSYTITIKQFQTATVNFSLNKN